MGTEPRPARFIDSRSRRLRCTAAALLFAMSPVTAARPAWCQGAADDATTKAARDRFHEGVEAYDKKQYEAARAAFLQAYALRKHPAVLLNLAQSSLKSNHHAEAVRYFQQYLREANNITPAQRSDAENGIKEGRAKLGRIEVSAPTAAEITVDGVVVGAAPLSDTVDVEPGSHTVKARLSDGSTDTRTVMAGAGEKVAVSFTSAAQTTVAPTTTTPAREPAATPAASAAAKSPDEPARHETVTPDTGTTNDKGLFDRPKTMVPVYIGGALVVLGVADAIVFALLKNSAQTKADATAADIRAKGGGPGTCVSTDRAVQQRFGEACRALTSNNDTIDADALAANIGVGVAIAGAALAVGWYLFAPKADKSPAAAWSRPPVRPVIRPGETGYGGAELELRF